jgi:hypothetical protein
MNSVCLTGTLAGAPAMLVILPLAYTPYAPRYLPLSQRPVTR